MSMTLPSHAPKRFPRLLPPPGFAPQERALRIGGWPARVLLWTADQWSRMDPADRPADAFTLGNTYLAIRVD